MSLFPQIQSPCPYKGNLADIMNGSVCRLCKREVHDLTFMSEAERFALVKGCKTEICVSYAVSARSALAALAMGAAAVATPALATDGDPAPVLKEIIVGGLRAPQHAKWVKDEPAAALPTLPVTYEDAEPALRAKARAAVNPPMQPDAS